MKKAIVRLAQALVKTGKQGAMLRFVIKYGVPLLVLSTALIAVAPYIGLVF